MLKSLSEKLYRNEEYTYKTILHIGNSFTSQKCCKYGSREACMREIRREKRVCFGAGSF
jgi:hypothetical protein